MRPCFGHLPWRKVPCHGQGTKARSVAICQGRGVMSYGRTRHHAPIQRVNPHSMEASSVPASPVRKASVSSWYKLALGNDKDAFEPTRQIQQVFMAKFLMSAPGSGRALFSSYDSVADNLWLYFSPAAADIAIRFRAEPCDKPVAPSRLGLLAGEGDALAVHFPEPLAA